MKNKCKCKYTSIGGQALIEGIMMKSPDKGSALAVRLPDGSIDITHMADKSIKDKYKILAIPVVRGVVGFVESMISGYKAMMLSADKSGYADTVDEETGKTEKLSSKAWTAIMGVAVVLAFILCFLLFMLLPKYAVEGLQWLFKTTFPEGVGPLIEQVIKLIIFLCYIVGVSFMKDIRRVFQYHGAEHKTIFCYEAGLPLTVENAKKQKRFHPRCGTSFMILMIIISVFFSTVVQLLFKGVYENSIVWALIKVAMVPIICGTGYEVLRLCGRYDNLLTRIISAPGVWMQRITTKEPDDSMLEIAIAALSEVLGDEDKERLLSKAQEETEETENNDDI